MRKALIAPVGGSPRNTELLEGCAYVDTWS